MFVHRLAQALLLASGLAAQSPEQCIAWLRDQHGKPVPAAHGTLLCAPPFTLPALADTRTPLLAGLLPATRVLSATADAHGWIRFTDPDRLPLHAGSGFVTTSAGLGALLVRLRPGQAQRLQLEPLGAVTTHSGSEEFTLFARAVLPAGVLVPLPPLAGTSVRLPAGIYEAWIASADGFAWQRLEVRSGQNLVLSLPTSGQVVATSAGTTLHPVGRPDVDLLARGPQCTLLGTALAAPLVTWHHGVCLAPGVLPGPASPKPLAWPPTTSEPAPLVPVPATGLPADAVAITLLRNAAGDYRVLGASAVRDDAFHLPEPPAGDSWVLFLAKGRAPIAVAWSLLRTAREATTAGVPLVVSARDERGLPLADVALEYEPGGMAPATVRGHTDGRGRADLGPALGPGVLRVRDERFANQTVELDAIPAAGLQLTVQAGSELRGKATWADGSVARGIVVTLRDPRGLLQPTQRAVATDDAGAFVFTGLPEDHALVVFASTQREGRTWTARIAAARAAAEGCELVLRNEDPVLQPPAGR